MKRNLASGYLALLLVSCGQAGASAPASSGGSPNGGASTAGDAVSWTDVLTELSDVTPSVSAFSLNYAGRIDGDDFVMSRWLGAILWHDVVDNACDDVGELSSDPSAAAGERWFLQVETSSTEPGVYPIVPSLDVLQTEPQAAVFLKQTLGKNELVRRTALAGSVEVISAPQSEEEWHAGVGLTGRLTAEFPEVFAREGRCAVSGVVGEEPPPPVCDCSLSDGTTFTCMRTGEYSCCHDFEAERRTFEVTFEAGQCARMCTGTSLTSQRCRSLQ